MTSDYLLIKLDETSQSFMAYMNCVLDGYPVNQKVKIDTGCAKSVIPFRRVGVTYSESLHRKADAIRRGLKCERSYGVSDTEEAKHRDRELLMAGKLLECTSLKFTHRLDRIALNGYVLEDVDIAVNYDRTGNILVGMDILRKFDMYLGESQYDGKYTMIACMKQYLNDGYYQALHKHFGVAKI